MIEHAIAIGDYAEAKESYEIVIRAGGVEGRTIMSPEEEKVIQTVIRRMDFKPIEWQLNIK